MHQMKKEEEYNHLEHRVFQWIININKFITHTWQSNVDTSYIYQNINYFEIHELQGSINLLF